MKASGNNVLDAPFANKVLWIHMGGENDPGRGVYRNYSLYVRVSDLAYQQINSRKGCFPQ